MVMLGISVHLCVTSSSNCLETNLMSNSALARTELGMNYSNNIAIDKFTNILVYASFMACCQYF